MANEDLFGIQPKCVIDSKIIPHERLRFKAVTCSKECGEIWARLQQKKRDEKDCKFCHKPSTPNARRAFNRFRKFERECPDIARPVEWEIVHAAGMGLEDFGKAIGQAQRSDIEVDVELREINWDRVKKPRATAKPTPELDKALQILADYVPPTKEEADGPSEKTADVPA